MLQRFLASRGPCGTVGVSLVLALQFVVLFFVALGTPYDVFRLRNNADPSRPECYSVWGRKRCGGNHPNVHHDALYKRCGAFEACMKAAASFCIISLFGIALTIFFSVLYICRFVTNKAPLLLCLIFCIATTLIPWSILAGLYHNSTCLVRFKDIAHYAAGFAFFIVAWGLEIIAFVIMIFS